MSGRISLSHQLGAFELGIDIALEPGVTAIFGPSGAGKTSVLRMVAGLMRPRDGRIEIGDHVLLDTATGVDLPPADRRLGVVFQDPRLFPHLSVSQNLRYGMGRGNSADFERLTGLMNLTGLLDRRPESLSGGEAQRVALARALLSAPRMLLMDEPLSALDLGLKREILPYFEELKHEAQLPIVYVSHDIDEVARLADRVVLMENGRASAAQPVADALAQAAPESRLARTIAGGLLSAEVAQWHEQDALTEARIGDQVIWMPGRIAAVGSRVRLRIEARDVTLSVARPEGLSALNILPVKIVAIDHGPGVGALVRLSHQGQTFSARLTAKSVRALNLTVGQDCHAILKTMSATPERVA